MSLVELMMMLSFAVLLLLGAVSGVLSHSAQRRIHGEKILAMAACRNTLETLRGVDFATLTSYHGTGFDVPGQNGEPGGLNAVPGDADGLPGEITVTQYLSQGGHVLYQVRTTVRWMGATRGGSFSMETLIGDRR
jgi:hypothetical protein